MTERHPYADLTVAEVSEEINYLVKEFSTDMEAWMLRLAQRPGPTIDQVTTVSIASAAMVAFIQHLAKAFNVDPDHFMLALILGWEAIQPPAPPVPCILPQAPNTH